METQVTVREYWFCGTYYHIATERVGLGNTRISHFIRARENEEWWTVIVI